MTLRFLLTRLLRGVTLVRRRCGNDRTISTHTPLARRDVSAAVATAATFDFYSHASCVSVSLAICRNSNFYSHASCEA